MPPNDDSTLQGRAGIIQAVQTPLGFFVLVVLIVEAIFGVFVFNLDGSDRTFVIQCMVYLIFALVAIVTGIALWRPSILAGKDQPIETKYSLLIGPPNNLPTLDISNISWNHDACFLICGELRKKITLVRSKVGPTFRVHIPDKVLNQVKDEAISLELKDIKGNRWEVKTFYLFENLLDLSIVESKAKIIQDYGEDEQ